MESNFGSCCKDLSDAISGPPNSTFRMEENGVLYMAVGYVNTERGLGWFESAVLFCPFCGTRLQERAEIQRKAGTTRSDA